MLCVLILHTDWVYSLESILNDRFLLNFFLAEDLLTGSRQRNTCLYFILLEMSDLVFESWPYVRYANILPIRLFN